MLVGKHADNVTVSVPYLHMSVESWVPKVYSVEAILLMSSAAPEKELVLHSSNTKHSDSCARLRSEKTHCHHSFMHWLSHPFTQLKDKLTLIILHICGSFNTDMEKEWAAHSDL